MSSPYLASIPTSRWVALGAPILVGLSLNVLIPPAHSLAALDRSTRNGAPGMSTSQSGSLLVGYYEQFLRDQDVGRFREDVCARYTEATLGRLIQSSDINDRRASVLALGLIGGFGANAEVGRALRDTDPTVRNLAENALWAIWFRADSQENNDRLEKIRGLIGREQYTAALSQATKLIADAPNFAEAYNQRALAYFLMGLPEQSSADCKAVLQRNPFHFGAIGGLGQCQLMMKQKADALETFRLGVKIQPFNRAFHQKVSALEAFED